MIEQFSKRTQEELKAYVYVLIDPRDNKIFYVGKGIENRVFSHVNEAVVNSRVTDKLDVIRNISADNHNVKYFIIRHGLEENEAFLLESVLIDFLTFKDFVEVAKVTNIVAGRHSFNLGIKTVSECELLYNCEPLNVNEIQHSILIININKTFENSKLKNNNPIYIRTNFYEATRGWWKLNIDRARDVDYVLAEYRGIIRAVFKPEAWLQDNENRGVSRWGFEGSEITDVNVLSLYLNKEVPKIKGMANPVRYFYAKSK